MKKLLCLILAGVMCISIVGCSNDKSKTDESMLLKNNSDSSLNTQDSTENEEVEVTSENSLKKMEDYLSSWIEFKEYGYDDSVSNSKSYHQGYNCVNHEFDMIIELDDGVVSLFSSTISDLLDKGYSLQSIEEIPSDETVRRRQVVLAKGNKLLKTLIRPDETDINSAIIRGLVLDAKDDSMGFYYSGFTKNNSSIDEVFYKLDSPSSIYISCDENGDNCFIDLAYSDSGVYFYFTYKYDALTDETTFDHIHLDT